MTNEQMIRALELNEIRIDLRDSVERAERGVVAVKEGKGVSWWPGDLCEIESLILADAIEKVVALRRQKLTVVESEIQAL